MSNLTFEPGTSRQFAAMHQSVVLGAKRTRTWPTMTGLQASDSRYFVGSATGDLVQLAKGGGGGRRPFEIRPSGTGMYDTFGDKRALFLKALEVYVWKTFEPLMSNSKLQGHRLLLSGAHWFIFQNAKIFPVQMVAWGLMLSVSSGCEMKT